MPTSPAKGTPNLASQPHINPNGSQKAKYATGNNIICQINCSLSSEVKSIHTGVAHKERKTLYWNVAFQLIFFQSLLIEKSDITASFCY
jgi:hypothetical protein